MPKSTPLILLIDDDRDFIEMNRMMLEARGFRTQCAHDPVEAWARLSAEKPDLIITDLMMSNLDAGFAFARQIKSDERFREVPIIILTSVSSQYGFDFHPRTSEELAAMSADAFFEKPTPAKLLIKKVEDLVKRHPSEPQSM